MVGAAAPAIPIVVEAVISLLLVLACLIALGFLWVYRATLKHLFIWLADLLDKAAINVGFKTIHVFGPLSNALRSLADTIDRALADLVNATQGGITFFWNLLAGQVRQLAGWIGDFAEAVERAFAGIVTVHVPKALLSLEGRLGRLLARTEQAVARRFAAVETAIAGAVTELELVLGRLRARADQLAKRLVKVERLTVGVGAAALVATALARMGLGWVRCRNVSRLGKRACSMDHGLLESLLADTLVVFGAFSLVAFAEELQGLVDDAERGLEAIVREL